MDSFLYCGFIKTAIVSVSYKCDLWFTSQVSSVTFIPESLRFFLSESRTSTQPQSSALAPVAVPARTCGHLGCYIGPSAIVSLGHIKWETHRQTDIWPLQKLFPVVSALCKITTILLLLSCRSDAASKLKLLHSGGWGGRQTVALKVQFTLFSPAPNLFTSVTMLAEKNPTGVLQPSAKVQSVRVYHTPAVWDYVVIVCQVKCWKTFSL